LERKRRNREMGTLQRYLGLVNGDTLIAVVFAGAG
jgi:hypothetical protein